MNPGTTIESTLATTPRHDEKPAVFDTPGGQLLEPLLYVALPVMAVLIGNGIRNWYRSLDSNPTSRLERVETTTTPPEGDVPEPFDKDFNNNIKPYL